MDTGTSTFQSTFHTARNRWAVSVAKFGVASGSGET